MKYEWKTVKLPGYNGKTYEQQYLNTPRGCMTVEGDETILHPGLNLTEDGEWIPAPGFESRGAAEQCREHLECTNELEKKIKRIADWACAASPHGKSPGYNSAKAHVAKILRGEA